MSLHEYRIGLRLADNDPPFYALIQAAMRKADSVNAAKLRNAFPQVWNELQARYNVPGGILPSDDLHACASCGSLQTIKRLNGYRTCLDCRALWFVGEEKDVLRTET